MSQPPYWWEHLTHGGLLIGPAQLEEHYSERVPPLTEARAEKLRRAVTRPDRNALLDTVLEDILGLEAHYWLRKPDSGWSHDAITKEKVRPRRVWVGPNGATVPVFDAESVPGFKLDEKTKIGIGRGRQLASRVVEWLRKDTRTKFAILTTGRQWRLIHAGESFDAWCQWDTELWFQEGKPSPQVDALRALLGYDSVTPAASGQRPKLTTAILDSRRGEAELSSALGERVRQAVERLIQSCTRDLDKYVEGQSREHYNEVYLAATRLVMRCVVALFAEGRQLLPVGDDVYHGSYGIQGLREQLDLAQDDVLRQSHAGWARLIALFRLLYEGSDHGQFPIVRYGARLFEPGDRNSNDPVLAAMAVLENSEGPSDLDLKEILNLLTKTFAKLRYRTGARAFPVPVDFSALDTEYIGILYEGLLDFNLKRAKEPIIFLQIGDYPALPWSSLQAMEQSKLEALLENLKKKSSLAVAEDDDGSEDESQDGDAEESDGSDLLLDADQQVDADVLEFAIRIVKVAKLVPRRRGAMTDIKKKQYDEDARKRASSIFRVVKTGEWYLVRFGNTRKGSGTFYTRPQLAAPTVRRTLYPLCYSEDGSPRTPDEILALKVCDPSMGSGSFLISATRYLTDALLASLYYHDRVVKQPGVWICRIADGIKAEHVQDETAPMPRGHADAEARLRARLRRYVVERCIYGVDIDDMAVELGRMALWIETMDRELPFGFLDHKIKPGNALVGCWFDRFEDYPATAWLREGGDKDVTFVNKGRVNWTKAIAKRLTDQVKPALTTWIGLNQQLTFTSTGVSPEIEHDRAMRLLDEMHALAIHEVDERRSKYEEIRQAPAFQSLCRAMDLWCALWFWPGDQLNSAPLPGTLLQPTAEALDVVDRLKSADRSYRFFHWELEFPDVFGGNRSGFDAVIGNPPWEIQKPNSKEFFSNLDPLYRGYGKTEAEAQQKVWFGIDQQIEWDWYAERARLKALSNWVKSAGRPFGDYTRRNAKGDEEWVFPFKGGFDGSADLHKRWRRLRKGRKGYADSEHPFQHQGSADLNTYKMFLEAGYRLLRDEGRIGFIVPSGVYSDKGSTSLRTLFLDKSRWEWLFGFENRDGIFDIHRSFKFAPVIVQKGGETTAIRTAFMQRSLSDWEDGEKFALDYPRERVLQFSPSSRAFVEIRNQADGKTLERVYADSALLSAPGEDGWGLQYTREFDMGNDASRFPRVPVWERKGYVADQYGHWLKGSWSTVTPRAGQVVHSRDGLQSILVDEIEDVALPYFQGGIVHQFEWCSRQFDGRAWRPTSDVRRVLVPKHLMSRDDYVNGGRVRRGLKLGFRDIARTTDQRSMIASAVPDMPCGDTLPVLWSSITRFWVLAAVLNSFVFDWITRQRLTGTHLKLFTIADLPLPSRVAAGILEKHCGALLFTGEVFAPIWRVIGERSRFWRSEWAITDSERLRLRCITDAVVARLYNISDAEFRRILRDCDHPVVTDELGRTLDPKGFWRVDKEKSPELRHTVLAQVASATSKKWVSTPSWNRGPYPIPCGLQITASVTMIAPGNRNL